MRLFLFVLFSLFLASVVSAQTKLQGRSSRPSPKKWLEASTMVTVQPLRILSWNVYLLPGIAPCPGRVKRAKAIGSVLRASSYDVICLQETFHRRARNILIDSLRQVFPYHIGPIHPDRPFRTSSGLMVFSKTPMDSLGVIAYTKNRRSDRVAQKGALLLRGSHRGKAYQIAVTHAQSENEPEVRMHQFNQLYNSLLSPHRRQGEMQILCGDLNVPHYDTLQYNNMLNTLQMNDCRMMADTLFSYSPGLNQLAGKGDPFTIDYFLTSTRQRLTQPQSRVVVFKKNWTRRKSDLSDHYAMEWEVILE